MSSVNPSFVQGKNVCEASCSHHRGIMAESSPFCTASTCDHVTFYLPPPYLLLPSGGKQIRTWQRRRQEHVYIKYQIINPKHVLIRDEIDFFFTRPALQVILSYSFLAVILWPTIVLVLSHWVIFHAFKKHKNKT